MAVEKGADGDDGPEAAVDNWSALDREAARAVERRCGISLVPGDVGE